MPLGGPADDPQTRWALIFGLLTSRDPATARRNITLATVGRFDGRTFVKEFEQELDFATDAYAFQAFVDHSGPVGIAWLANWTEISKKIDFPTAMPVQCPSRQGGCASDSPQCLAATSAVLAILATEVSDCCGSRCSSHRLRHRVP